MNYRILLALALLVVPGIARGLWFYRGTYKRTEAVELPAYADFTVPEIPLNVSTPTTALTMTNEAMSEQADTNTAHSGVVVIDRSHANAFELDELKPLLDSLATHHARVEVVNKKEETFVNRLKYASSLVIVAPLKAYTPVEVNRIRQFVQQGGRVLVVADPTRFQFMAEDELGMAEQSVDMDLQNDAAVAAVNGILAPYDLAFTDDFVYNIQEHEGNFRNVFFSSFGENAITDELSQVVLYAARSVSTPSGHPLIIGDDQTRSSRTDIAQSYAVAALSNNEQVLAIGDLTFLTNPYVLVADNARLVDNIARFLAGATRTYEVYDIPYVFQRPVALVTTKDITIQASNLIYAGALQSYLREADMVIEPADRPMEGFDLLTLGVYTTSHEIKAYLRPFAIDMPTHPLTETIEVAGFGEVDPNGVGMLLVSSGKSRTMVVMLAQSVEYLGNLITLVLEDKLGACAVRHDNQPNTDTRRIITLCPVGEPVAVPDTSDANGGENGTNGEQSQSQEQETESLDEEPSDGEEPTEEEPAVEEPVG